MEIRQLRSFINVARLLSFNRAARKMHYAQSSVSAQIHALEEELGVKLFDRLGKTIILTEAGERLVQYAEKITALEEETRSELKSRGAAPGFADHPNAGKPWDLSISTGNQGVCFKTPWGSFELYRVHTRRSSTGFTQGGHRPWVPFDGIYQRC